MNWYVISPPLRAARKVYRDEEKYDVFQKQFENLSDDCKKLLQLSS
jgi:hypothetical protein